MPNLRKEVKMFCGNGHDGGGVKALQMDAMIPKWDFGKFEGTYHT